jgi:hypothetical protein
MRPLSWLKPGSRADREGNVVRPHCWAGEQLTPDQWALIDAAIHRGFVREDDFAQTPWASLVRHGLLCRLASSPSAREGVYVATAWANLAWKQARARAWRKTADAAPQPASARQPGP